MMRTMTIRMAASLLMTCAAAMGVAAASAEDAAPSWPCFHGADGSNVSAETGLMREWPEGGPELIQTISGIGEGFSGVAIYDGRIATLGTADDPKGDGVKTTVFCFDMAGEPLWKTDLDYNWDANYPGSRSTPTFHGDKIYVETPFGLVVCMKASDGEVVWWCDLREKYGATTHRWGRAESPIIDRNRVIVGPFTDQIGFVALDAETGEEQMRSEPVPGGVSYTTPLIVKCDSSRILLSMSDAGFVAVDPDTGKFLFDFPKKTMPGACATTPLFRDGQIFISAGYGAGSTMLRVTEENGKPTMEKVGDFQALDNQHGGIVLVGDRVFGSSHRTRGRWFAVDWNTGREIWSADSVGQGSLTSADERLYFVGEDERTRQVALIDATTDEYRECGRLTLPGGGQSKIWAHPVICDGKLYIRHGDFLYIYDVKAK